MSLSTLPKDQSNKSKTTLPSPKSTESKSTLLTTDTLSTETNQTTSITPEKKDPPIFLDTSDSQAVHVTLNENLPEFFKTIPNVTENHNQSNIYIIISLVSIFICAGLHFCEWLLKWEPKNSYTIPSFIVFFGLQVVLFVLAYFSDGLVYASNNFKFNGALRNIKAYVHHQLYSTDYKVIFEYYSVAKKKKTTVEETFQVTSFFNTNGRFLRENFNQALLGLWNNTVSSKKED